MGGTAERQALLKLGVAALVTELVFCAGLEQGDVAVGADRAGIDADQADVVGEALAAECAGECHDRGIAGAAADIVCVEPFAGGADVVDDETVSACLHLRVDRAGEVDIAERLEVPGVTPGRLVDLVERAAGNVAGIVDEDVDVGGILRKSCKILWFTQVNDMGGGVDLMGRSQTLGERLQLIAAAGGKAAVAALLR